MKRKHIKFVLCLFTIIISLSANGQVNDLKNYFELKDEMKKKDISFLEEKLTDPKETNLVKGLAAYLLFLKYGAQVESSPPSGKLALKYLSIAVDTFMNPSGYTNLAKLHFSGSDAFKVKANKELSLKYLAISWEIAEVTNTATKDNTILTMIINGTLGLGDTFYMEENQGGLNMTKAIEDMKPEVLMERDRFKKLYLLSVTDQYPGSLAIDRHY